MPINVVVAKAHEEQCSNDDISRERESIESAVNALDCEFKNGTVNFMFVKGIYEHASRSLVTICLFINKTDYAINELHGELRLAFVNEDAKIAKAIVDFDEPFMGELKPDDALLVHMGIPVKGLKQDKEYKFSGISGTFDNVRITKVSE